jgi:hypothetical protein
MLHLYRKKVLYVYQYGPVFTNLLSLKLDAGIGIFFGGKKVYTVTD